MFRKTRLCNHCVLKWKCQFSVFAAPSRNTRIANQPGWFSRLGGCTTRTHTQYPSLVVDVWKERSNSSSMYSTLKSGIGVLECDKGTTKSEILLAFLSMCRCQISCWSSYGRNICHQMQIGISRLLRSVETLPESFMSHHLSVRKFDGRRGTRG